jgi:hypothetical protein
MIGKQKRHTNTYNQQMTVHADGKGHNQPQSVRNMCLIITRSIEKRPLIVDSMVIQQNPRTAMKGHKQ